MVKKLFAFLFSPKGRFSRRSFGLSVVSSVVLFGLYLWYVAKHLDTPPEIMLTCGLAILGIYFIGNVKRFHDFGYSGWTTLWVIIPPVYLYFLYLLACRDGDKGENEFGPPEGAPAPKKKKAGKPPVAE